MIKRLVIAAGIGLALSGTAFAEGAAKTGPKASGSTASDPTSNAIAQCDTLTGPQKANCLQQAKEALDRSATGSTTGSASGRAGAAPAGAAPSASQPKDSAPSAPKGY